MGIVNKEQLLGDAGRIRREVVEGQNTAERVGKLFQDIIESFAEHYLSRIGPDRAQGLIQFLEGAEFGNFVPGIVTGKGGRIDRLGNGELESLVIRRFLEVPELRYNRIEILIGNKWNAPGGGIIQSVEIDRADDGSYLPTGIIHLKLEDGEIGTVCEDDICMGIYHNEANANANSPVNYDDSIGNFRFAGFCTSYFRITEIIERGRNSVFRYALRPVSDTWGFLHHPCEGMHFVGYGNFSRPERQTCKYETRTYERYLKDVRNWEFDANNIAAQFGDLTNLDAFGLDMTGYSAYLSNIYLTGTIEQVNALFLRIEIETDGDNFMAYGETKEIRCRVMRGWEDVSDRVVRWSISRDSADSVEDESWGLKDKARNFGGTITLSFTDAENDLSANPVVASTVFTIRAEVTKDKAEGSETPGTYSVERQLQF